MKPFFTVAAGICFFAPAALSPAVAVELVPHEAIYEMTIDSVRGGEEAQGGSGQFVLRLERTCRTWVLVSRLEFTLDFGAGRTLALEQSAYTEETLDGLSLSFNQEQRLNDQVIDSMKGRAALTGDDNPGLALFDEPPDLRMVLPPETLFPVAAATMAVENYEKGEKFQSYLMFSGDSVDGPHQVTEIITGAVDRVEHEAEGDLALLAEKGWQVSVSFFDYGAQDAEPTAMQRGAVLANGVTPWFSIDMGLIVAGARLVNLRALKEPEC